MRSLNGCGRRPTISRDYKSAWAHAFPDDDRLLLLVREAQKALQALCMEIHYLSCDGVGKPRKGNEKDASRQSR